MSDEELEKIINSLTRRKQSEIKIKGDIVQIKVPLKGRIDSDKPLFSLSRPSKPLLFREYTILDLTTNGPIDERKKIKAIETMKAGSMYLTYLRKEKTELTYSVEFPRKTTYKISRNAIDHPNNNTLMQDFVMSYQNARKKIILFGVLKMKNENAQMQLEEM